VNAVAEMRSRRLELACFAALAALVALQWESLVTHPPAGRVLLAVLLATTAGGAVALAGAAPGRTRWALGTTALVVAVCLGCVVVGLPARLLLPAHWDELGHNVGRSLNGLGDVPVPYAGADVWTRLVILLAAPLAVALAAFAAFWPTRRRVAGRVAALVLLVGLYLVAVAWARPSRQIAGGVLLALLVSAWLWLPSIRPAGRPAAAIAVVAAALVAIPAAAALQPSRPLINYRHWNVLSANGIGFRWDQTYGPLNWPQKGTRLLEVASDHTHYWKATNLDRFDGTRWVRSSAQAPEPALGEPLKFHPKGTPPRPNPEWVSRVNFVDRGLSTDLAIGAGTVLSLSRTQARPAHDGVWEMTHQLHPGDTYTALVYDPKPSPAQMLAAGTAFPAATRRYVSFTLDGGAGGPRSVNAPFWVARGPASIENEVRGTPYAGMYALARRLTARARAPYDAARRIEAYLRDNFAYRQHVPSHRYPLAAFLAADRAGYCQQFSGAMALMLRMLGIPARVAAGFAPGGRDPERNNFLVDDTDAHNWVEVYFPRIGWVTFDPTPGAAPAATQLDDNALGVTKPGPGRGPDTAVQPNGPRAPNAHGPRPVATDGTGPVSASSDPAATTLLAAGAGAAALVSLGAYGLRARRRRGLGAAQLADAELRELDRALERIGAPLPPGTTLRRAEWILGGFAGPSAARYAAALRERRYRDPRAEPPGVADRRSLRRALLRTVRRREAWKVLLALPPGGPNPRTGRGSPTTSP
jgi:protein-glutamine gamma-glutamyltransferase